MSHTHWIILPKLKHKNDNIANMSYLGSNQVTFLVIYPISLNYISLGLQVSFLCYVKVCTMLLFCALSPKNQLGGNATVPLTHIRLQAEYFIASLVGNLIPPISTLNHKTFNLTSVLLYFVHFLLFFY